MLNSNLIERLEARANGIASALSGYSTSNFDGSSGSAVVPSINSLNRTFWLYHAYKYLVVFCEFLSN